MTIALIGTGVGERGISELRLPKAPSFSNDGDEPAVAPVEEPTTVPVEPDVTPEPNTVPFRRTVPEPPLGPCERPDTSCPVHR